jgi:hypothetical protein
MTNIIKCTVKKSISTTLKILKWGSLIGIILAAVIGIGYGIWSIRDIIGSGWEAYTSWSSSIISMIGNLLAGVPWYVWIIIAIPSCIISYSYLWCYNRQNPGKIRKFLNRYGESILALCLGLGFGGVLQILLFWTFSFWTISPENQALLQSYPIINYIPLLAGLLAGFIGMICADNE